LSWGGYLRIAYFLSLDFTFIRFGWWGLHIIGKEAIFQSFMLKEIIQVGIITVIVGIE
jgi:hypothetical protein